MTFRLHVDGSRWSNHLASVRRAFPGLVPVIKGNGYGFGQGLAAKQAAQLRLDTVAVGVPGEIADVAERFAGEIVVLEPWDPSYSVGRGRLFAAQRVVLTISRADALRAIAVESGVGPPIRVVLEGRTSLQRFGMSTDELADGLSDPVVADAVTAGRLQVVGLSLHLPMTQPEVRNVAVLSHDAVPPVTGRVREVLGWSGVWSRARQSLSGTTTTATPTMAATVWVSHLAVDEVTALRRLVPDLDLRHRVGTRLWLGDRQAYAPRATVLAVHDVSPGTRVGYRQRRAPRGTRVLVVAGGTAHGVALTAPSPAGTARQRVVTAGTGALDAVGRARSPFTVAGRRLWFAEPPHAQVSMLWLPDSAAVPRVGDAVDVDVRMTTVRFDEVVIVAPGNTAS